MIRMSESIILASLLLVSTGLAGASGQEQPATSRVAMLEVPHALRMEHKYLREDLARALAEPGGVGNAAREIERALLPHLDREEKLPLRPLGLLRGIARDATSTELAQAVSMAVQIERELPTLFEEHRVIGEAAKRLVDVARRERKPQYQALADRLWLHARVAEEVLYPAAILVGEHVRVTHGGKPGTARRPNP
jgi:Hemerythrin HHE cation binding domain